MKAKPTNNQFLAEAQARQLSRECGEAFVISESGTYVATVSNWTTISKHLTAIAKFENGKQVSL